ncbi:MAG: aminomethyl-transferring glycine dehydrogenase subunit GcvPA [Candidatus Thorarchaeota archaeon]
MPPSTQFSHPYLPQTSNQIKHMLNTIGVTTIEDLFSSIPSNLRCSTELDLPEPHSELETLLRVKAILAKNQMLDKVNPYLGAGLYNHFIPTTVPAITNRSEFYTSYTPYQPEMSQGMLQALWEYQSMIAELMQLDIVNSSMYDMATALGEAALMCTRVTHNEVFIVPECLQPERFQTLETYTRGPQIKIVTYPYDRISGSTDIETLEEIVSTHAGKISGIYLENPNFWGIIEADVERIGELANNHEALFVIGCDPISLGLLKSPGECGADIAIASGQSLGLSMDFGGPLLGLFAVRNERRIFRSMPGRIIGLTTEQESPKRAFTMTLQTREQHIRREKATSNICTNNALNALAATVFLGTLGPQGLKQLAETCMSRTAYLMDRLSEIQGITSPYFSGPVFREFVYKLDPKMNLDYQKTIIFDKSIGFPLEQAFPDLANCFLATATEMSTTQSIDEDVTAFSEALRIQGGD